MLDTVLSLLQMSDPLKINNSLCPHNKTIRFSCQKCMEVCPTKGLKREKGNWFIDECTYCGKCAAVCPTGVFTQDTDFLLKRVINNESLVIGCSVLSHNLPEKLKNQIVWINCLNQLFSELVIFLLSQVKNLTIYNEENVCAQCAGFNIQEFKSVIDDYGNFCEKITFVNGADELQQHILEDPQIVACGQLGRRDFFKFFINTGRKTSQKIIAEKLNSLDANSEPSLESNSIYSQKRMLLLRALKKMQQDKNPLNPNILLPFNKLIIEKCNFCEVCTKLCPTHALKIITAEDRKTIQHSVVDCTECGLCLDVCLFGKIRWGDQVRTEYFLKNTSAPLASAQAQQCSQCLEYFYNYPEKEICSQCEKKEEYKFFTTSSKED